MGKTPSEETRLKLSLSHKGVKHSLERTQKRIGHKQKPESIAKRIAKISGDNHWIKRKGGHSEQTKLKISNSLKGKMIGEKNPAFGKKMTDETKKKISAKIIGVKRNIESIKKQIITIKMKNETKKKKIQQRI